LLKILPYGTAAPNLAKSGQNSDWSQISKKGLDAGFAGAEIRHIPSIIATEDKSNML